MGDSDWEEIEFEHITDCRLENNLPGQAETLTIATVSPDGSLCASGGKVWTGSFKKLPWISFGKVVLCWLFFILGVFGASLYGGAPSVLQPKKYVVTKTGEDYKTKSCKRIYERICVLHIVGSSQASALQWLVHLSALSATSLSLLAPPQTAADRAVADRREVRCVQFCPGEWEKFTSVYSSARALGVKFYVTKYGSLEPRKRLEQCEV